MCAFMMNFFAVVIFMIFWIYLFLEIGCRSTDRPKWFGSAVCVHMDKKICITYYMQLIRTIYESMSCKLSIIFIRKTYNNLELMFWNNTRISDNSVLLENNKMNTFGFVISLQIMVDVKQWEWFITHSWCHENGSFSVYFFNES